MATQNQQLSVFGSIKLFINSLMSAATRAAVTLDKTVQLVEAEVDNLHDYQKIRLEENQKELALLKAE
jgi:hypothetical protein